MDFILFLLIFFFDYINDIFEKMIILYLSIFFLDSIKISENSCFAI